MLQHKLQALTGKQSVPGLSTLAQSKQTTPYGAGDTTFTGKLETAATPIGIPQPKSQAVIGSL
jgi:hypothetical protein